MRIVFGTVVYKQAWQWWDQFVDSINNQDYDAFDCLILNDGLTIKELKLLRERLTRKCEVVNIESGVSISDIRKKLLKKSKTMGYDLLILGDFDDIFPANRVRKIFEAWNEKVGFFYHNICFDNRNETVFKALPEEVTTYEQILEANFLGLSNTALNLGLFEESFFDSLESVKTNVFDWYLYAKILLCGIKGILVKDTYTVYRQQENNIAGVICDDNASIYREIEIKKEQYRLLQEDSAITGKLFEEYRNMENLSEEELSLYRNKCSLRYWWSNLKVYNIGGKENV